MHIALHVMWPCSTFLPVFPANIICICNKSDGYGARKLGFVIGLLGKFFKEVYYVFIFLPIDEIHFLLAYFSCDVYCSFFCTKNKSLFSTILLISAFDCFLFDFGHI